MCINKNKINFESQMRSKSEKNKLDYTKFKIIYKNKFYQK